MLLYIMLHIVLAYLVLYIVLAYLMLFAALSNAVCLHNASFFANDSCNCFLSSCFFYSLGLLTHSMFISCINLHHAQCF